MSVYYRALAMEDIFDYQYWLSLGYPVNEYDRILIEINAGKKVGIYVNRNKGFEGWDNIEHLSASSTLVLYAERNKTLDDLMEVLNV